MKIRLLLLVLAIAAVAGLAALVFHSRSERHSANDTAPPGDKVKVELRAMPPATIHVDGKKLGTTPMSLQYPRSQKRVVVEATMVRHFVMQGGTKDEVFKETREITLDRDQLHDFAVGTAKLVDTVVKMKDEPEPPAGETPK